MELERLRKKEREQARREEKSSPVKEAVQDEASLSSTVPRGDHMAREQDCTPPHVSLDIAFPLDDLATSYPDLRTRISEVRFNFS